MLTPIVHDLLVAYATTLDALLRADRDDTFLHELLRREYLDAQADLYGHLWKFSGGRIDAGRVVVQADSEGSVSLRARSRVTGAERLALLELRRSLERQLHFKGTKDPKVIKFRDL